MFTHVITQARKEQNGKDRVFCTRGFITASQPASEPHSNASLSVTLSYVTLHLHNGTHDAGINGLMRATRRHDGPAVMPAGLMPACLHGHANISTTECAHEIE